MKSQNWTRLVEGKRFLTVLKPVSKDEVSVTTYSDSDVPKWVLDKLTEKFLEIMGDLLAVLPRSKLRCKVCGRDILLVDPFSFAIGYYGYFEEFEGVICGECAFGKKAIKRSH